jgi:hypothetical protein
MKFPAVGRVMSHTALAPALAVALVAGLGAGLSTRAALSSQERAPLVGSHVRESAADVVTVRELGATFPRSTARTRVRSITLRVDPERQGFGAFSETWGDNLVFDKNGDGNPDVLLSFHNLRPWTIWLGKDGAGFTFDRELSTTDRHNCATADFAGPGGTPPDGRADLYCVRGADMGTLQDKRNALLIQRAGGGFVNVADAWDAADPSGRGRTVSVLDIRGNARPSLFVGNAKTIVHPSKDHLFVNVGGRFLDRHTGGLPSEQNTMCSAVGDFDRDGRQDFLSCSDSLRLYRNLTTPAGRVTFRQVAARQGIPVGRPRDAGLVDLNRDGWRDLVIVSDDALRVRLNRRRPPHFSRVDFRFPLSAGASFCSGRANGDAATDLLVVQGLASLADNLQRRDWMLVNSGTGKRFRALPVPQPAVRNGRNGNGDTCSSIRDYDGRRAAWTINNGRPTYVPETRHHRGYRQLVILR